MIYDDFILSLYDKKGPVPYYKNPINDRMGNLESKSSINTMILSPPEKIISLIQIQVSTRLKTAESYIDIISLALNYEDSPQLQDLSIHAKEDLRKSLQPVLNVEI